VVGDRHGAAVALFIIAGVVALGIYGFVATFSRSSISVGSWPPTAACS
jgi:hypothetical protein